MLRMHPDAPSTRVDGDLRRIVEANLEDLVGSDRNLLPGGALVLAVACLQRRPLEGAWLDSAARFLSLDPPRLAEIAAFGERMLGSADAQARPTVTRCCGVSCSLHGARRLHAALDRMTAAGGDRGECVETHCLGHCEEGPSIRIENRVFLARAQRVVVDERTWRERP